MHPTRTCSVRIRPDLYHKAVDALAAAIAGDALVSPGSSAGDLPYFTVEVARGALSGFVYYVANDHRQPVLSDDGRRCFRAGETIGVLFTPRDFTKDPRGLSVYQDGPARGLALAHIARFVAILDDLHGAP